jgi:hypothetical protein
MCTSRVTCHHVDEASTFISCQTTPILCCLAAMTQGASRRYLDGLIIRAMNSRLVSTKEFSQHTIPLAYTIAPGHDTAHSRRTTCWTGKRQVSCKIVFPSLAFMRASRSKNCLCLLCYAMLLTQPLARPSPGAGEF